MRSSRDSSLCRERATALLEADALLGKLAADVGDTCQVEHHLGLLGAHGVDRATVAGGAQRLDERSVLALVEAQRQNLASLKTDVDGAQRHGRASVLGRLDELGEHPADGFRVYEGDAAVANAAPRLLVDQPQPGGTATLEGGLDVVGRVGDVVQSGAVALQKPGDSAVGADGLEQLDVAFADVEQDRFDPERLHDLAVGERHAERALVQLDGGVEILDGDADVVDVPEHAPAV